MPSQKVIEARERALENRRKVMRKRNRLERNKYVDWENKANAKYLPMLSPQQINRMTLKQLEAANRRMEQFVSRKTQFYGDSHGVILNPLEVKKYRKLERDYLKKHYEEFSKYADIPVSNEGRQTVYDIWHMVTPSFGITSETAESPLSRKSRSMHGVTSNKSLRIMIKDMERKNSPEYFHKQSKMHRQVIEEMFEKLGDDDNLKKVQSMSDFQVDALFNNPRFIHALTLKYDIVWHMYAEANEHQRSMMDHQISDADPEINEGIDWATGKYVRRAERKAATGKAKNAEKVVKTLTGKNGAKVNVVKMTRAIPLIL